VATQQHLQTVDLIFNLNPEDKVIRGERIKVSPIDDYCNIKNLSELFNITEEEVNKIIDKLCEGGN
jgi:hypothetical protein